MTKFDPDEHSIFIDADRIRSSVRWKLRDDGENAALSEEQIKSLAAKFALKADDLRELSLAIAMALNPLVTPNLIPISRSTAATRGAGEVKQALREVATAKYRVRDASMRLDRLYTDRAADRDGAEQFRQTRKLLNECDRRLIDAEEKLGKLAKSPDFVLVIAPDDERSVSDGRRGIVLHAIFRFWEHAGGKLSYTTDPLNSQRRGPLIDFVNAVIACVSDPPATLGGETIVAEFRAFRTPKPRQV